MKNITNILNFAETLIGVKYNLWTPDTKNDIFYCDRIPNIIKLQHQGVNCAGFINILRHYSGLSIPENKWLVNDVPTGGTRFWFNYFNKLGRLKTFNYDTIYPLGTLFLRDYKDDTDQGHLAVLYEYRAKYPDKLLFADIIHSYYMDHIENGGVGISNLGMSYFHNIDKITNSNSNDNLGYYEYAILPHNWLAI